MRVEIIAEAGLNHNGDLKQAMWLVDAAKSAGADTIKFQQSIPELEVVPDCPVADYQRKQGYSDQGSMIRSLMLRDADTVRLASYCRSVGIEFLSTPADPVSLKFLIEACGIKRIKIGSDNLTNPQMLLAAAKTDLPLIISTGMATFQEVSVAMALVWRRRELDQVTLMQCTSCYPCEIDDAQIAAIFSLKKVFGYPVGFSDHTIGPMAALVAVGAGACIIEKHLTLDRASGGPDHAMSTDPNQFTIFVDCVRKAARYMGDGIKPVEAEKEVAKAVRKSLVAARDIKAGEEFDSENIAVKRPGIGRPPLDYFDLIGKPARRAYRQDEMIE